MNTGYGIPDKSYGIIFTGDGIIFTGDNILYQKRYDIYRRTAIKLFSEIGIETTRGTVKGGIYIEDP